MSHHRRVFFDEGSAREGQELLLDADSSHHLLRVLRTRIGERLTAIHKASGKTFDAILVTDGKQACIKLARQIGAEGTDCSPRIETLALALLKGDKNDLVIEKAVELGVQSILLWSASRSVPDPRDPAAKIKRWQRIADSAAIQCRRPSPPPVEFAHGLQDAIGRVNTPSYFCSLAPRAKEIKMIEAPRSPIALWVGPEGDFTSDEESLLLESGAVPVSLGSLVLRSETAAIVAMALCQGVWGSVSL